MQMHKETLQAELKMVREDIHRVTLELTERQQRVDKLHAKHDVLISRNATPDGEVHTQVSVHTAAAVPVLISCMVCSVVRNATPDGEVHTQVATHGCCCVLSHQLHRVQCRGTMPVLVERY